VNSLDKLILSPFSFDGGEFEMPSPDTAEAHANAHDGSAAYFEDKGRADLANKERKLAAWWRGLAALSGADADRLCGDLFLKGTETIDAFLALQGKSGNALAYLGFLSTYIWSRLLDLTADGHKPAVLALLSSIGQATNDLEFIANRKPELFREWARRSIAIPGLISRNKAQARDNDRLLDTLQQGKDTYLASRLPNKRGRFWAFEGPNLLAVRLIAHIQSSNNFYESHKLLARYGAPKMPRWRTKAAKLKPFSAETWRSWAEVAWQMLTQISPEKRPALNSAFYDKRTQICNVRNKRKNPYYQTEEKALSIAEQDIKEALFGAFELIATGKSRRTKQRLKAKEEKQ
jgi:hypothetical protein